MIKIFIGIILFLATATPCWAAVVRLREVSAGRFLVEGEGLANVAALNLVIDYDSATWQVSDVSAGSILQGMLFAGNPNQAGRVQIGAVGTQVISGSGILAIISGSVRQQPTIISGFSAKLSDASGRSLPLEIVLPQTSASSRLLQPDDSQLQSSTEIVTTRASNPKESRPVHVAPVELPAPWRAREVDPSPIDSSTPALVPPLEPASQISEVSLESEISSSAPYIDKQLVGFPSVLSSFETYSGPRSLAAMVLLFSNKQASFVQRPAILLADGDAGVEIELITKTLTEPSVALKNARLRRTAFVAEHRFQVRCTPKLGAMSAQVIILGDKQIIKIPLTVAPRVSLSALENLTDGALPKLDMDGDGENTWRDDYILLANLLAQREEYFEGSNLPDLP